MILSETGVKRTGTAGYVIQRPRQILNESRMSSSALGLFTEIFPYLHYNTIERGIDHIRILTVDIELAGNGGLCLGSYSYSPA